MAKRGRKRLMDGAEEIRRAEKLFNASIEAGAPDFGFVALAIGASPLYPPDWAVFACINHKMRVQMRPPMTQQLTPRGTPVNGKIVDDAIRILTDFDDGHKWIAAALRDAAELNGANATEQELENLRAAWDREIEQSTAEWADADAPPLANGLPLPATRRIARVLRQIAIEKGEADLSLEDQQALVWLLKAAGKIKMELKFSASDPE